MYKSNDIWMKKVLIFVLIFIIVFLIIVARRPDIIMYAQPWAEDGQVWMPSIYNDGFLHSVISPQNGYYQTISRITFGIALCFGLTHAALIANIVAISIRCFFILFFLSSRIKFIPIQYRIAAVIYFLLMPNLTEGYVNITNVQWYLSLYLFMVIFANEPNSLLWKIHDAFVLILSGLSGPFVIFLTICLLIKRLSQRGGIVNTIKGINFFDIIMILCCITQVTAILMTIGSSVRSSAPLGASFNVFVNIISYRIIGGTFFSNQIISGMASKEWLNFILFFAFVITVCIFFYYSRWRFWISVLFPALIIAFSFAKPMISLTEPQWPIILQGAAERYFFISNFAFFCFTLLIISYMGKFSKIILCGLMICLIPSFYLCFSMYPFERLGYKEDIAKFETLPKGQEMSIRINPSNWYMILKKK